MNDTTRKIEYVALNKLSLDPKNVRKTVSQASLGELKASIEHKGILQNLVVRPDTKKGHFLVTAGGRRYSALQALVEDKKIPPTYGVPVRIGDEESAEDMSLSENLIRQGMHPMDEFEAFTALEAKGTPIDDIAMRYGTTSTIVKKRLSIARVAPELIELFRADEIGLEAIQALTLTDDHDEQMRVWKELPSWDKSSRSIRSALTEQHIPATNKRVRFVGGLEVYEAAGGAVKRDLFNEHCEGYVIDVNLLHQLVTTKLETVAATIKAQGWDWVKLSVDYDHEDVEGLTRYYPSPRELTEAEQERLATYEAEAEALDLAIDEGNADDNAEAQLEALNREIDELQAEVFSAEQIASSGVYITLNHNGEVSTQFGLYAGVDRGCAQSNNEPVEKPVHSAKLKEDLTAQRTLALQLEINHNPKVALVAVVHAFLLKAAYEGWSARDVSCLKLSLDHAPARQKLFDAEGNSTLAQLQAVSQARFEGIPENPELLWDWCLERGQDELLALLATSVSGSLTAIDDGRSDRAHTKHLAHSDQIARAVELDMANYFKPTADTYFRYLRRIGVETVIGETCGKDGLDQLKLAKKKAETSKIAAKLVDKLAWLPEPLRARDEDNETGEVEADNAIMQAAQ